MLFNPLKGTIFCLRNAISFTNQHMQRLKSRLNLPLFSILLTAFIDLLGWGIVIPILPAFFLDSNSSIFPAGASLSTRSIILGLLLAAYPFTQFIGAPILGALSDRFGRKKVLLISMVGTLIGYVLFGLGILSSSLLLLFVSRLLDGFTGGNLTNLALWAWPQVWGSF